jgi:hypothetical protein
MNDATDVSASTQVLPAFSLSAMASLLGKMLDAGAGKHCDPLWRRSTTL